MQQWQKPTVLAFTLVSFVVGLRALFLGQVHFVGDPEWWYGLYHYFAEGFYNGSLQLWNPYMNGGEPFWPALGLFRLIDPLNLAFLLAGKFANAPLFYLYHIQFVIKIGITCAGCYLLLKRLIDWSLACLLAVVLFANYFFSVLLYDAYYMAFCWIPFIMLFFIRFLEDGRLSDFRWTVYFLGVYVGGGSYHFALGTFFLLCFVVPTIVWNRRDWGLLVRRLTQHRLVVSIAIVYLIVMSLPLVATMLTASKELYPIARTATHREVFENIRGVELSYAELMKEGTVASPEALLQLVRQWPYRPGTVSDFKGAFSLLVMSVMLLGVVLGRNKWKRHFLVLTGMMTVMVLGYHTPAHKVFYLLYWPLQYVRHTVVFYPFLMLAISYFLVLGLDEIRRRLSGYAWGIDVGLLGVTLAWLTYVATGANFFSDGEYAKNYYADFDHRAQP